MPHAAQPHPVTPADDTPVDSPPAGSTPPARLTTGRVTPEPDHTGSAARIREFPVIPEQRGLATSAQLHDHGWTTDALRHAEGRTIQRVYPRVFAAHRGPLDVEDRLVAAYLWAGDGAVLTGRVALARHGLDVPSAGSAIFLVPSTHRARRTSGVSTVRTTRSVPVAGFRDGVPLTDPARALCDAAKHQGLGDDALRAATMSLLQRRLSHPDRLRAELAERPRNGLAPAYRALDEFCSGAWSLPEAALARLVDGDPELPEFLLNVELRTPDDERVGVPDGYFPDSGVAVQVHSKAFHSGTDEAGKDRWTATVEKDGTMVEEGIVVVPITPNSIERRPQGVLTRLRRVVKANTGRTLPAVVVHPRNRHT